MPQRYWLMKSEPNVFSFQDLQKVPGKTTAWEGVRNYQARNFMRDEMKKGDGVLYYHSNAEPSGIAGLAVVAREAYPDPTQFEKKSEYYDAKATKDNPRWFLVDIKYDRSLKRLLPLEELRKVPALRKMVLLQKGSRLSVQPVTAEEWKAILKLGGLS